MLKVKRILIMVLLVCGLCLMNTSVQAAGELSPILKADGTNLKYRGTNNNVMGLTNYEYKVQDFRSTLSLLYPILILINKHQSLL